MFSQAPFFAVLRKGLCRASGQNFPRYSDLYIWRMWRVKMPLEMPQVFEFCCRRHWKSHGSTSCECYLAPMASLSDTAQLWWPVHALSIGKYTYEKINEHDSEIMIFSDRPWDLMGISGFSHIFYIRPDQGIMVTSPAPKLPRLQGASWRRPWVRGFFILWAHTILRFESILASLLDSFLFSFRLNFILAGYEDTVYSIQYIFCLFFLGLCKVQHIFTCILFLCFYIINLEFVWAGVISFL